jgi:hypothetical protein
MDLRSIASDSLLFDFQSRDENRRLSAIALSAGSLGDTRTRRKLAVADWQRRRVA